MNRKFIFVINLFFCQAEDGIRVLVRSRGLGDVYKRQPLSSTIEIEWLEDGDHDFRARKPFSLKGNMEAAACLLYTSDAADDLLCVDLGGRRIIKKKKHIQQSPLLSYF